MRVKVLETWFDSNDTPICLETNDGERDQIHNQAPGVRLYAQYPSDIDSGTIETWMKAGRTSSPEEGA